MSIINKEKNTIMNNKFFKYCISIILVLLILLLMKQMTYLLKPIGDVFSVVFLPVLLGGFFYYMLRPLARFLQKKKVNKSLSSIISIVALILILSVIIGYGGSSIASEFAGFTKNISNQIEVAKEGVNDFIKEKDLSFISLENMNSEMNSFGKFLLKGLGEGTISILLGITNIGSQLILVPFITFYLLKEEEKVAPAIMKLVPERYKIQMEITLRDIDNILSAYITGQMVVAFCIGTLMYIGYLIIGMPNALVLALIAMITTIIPYIGPILGIIPAIFLALTTNFSLLVKIAIVSIIAQQLEGNIISPKIMGDKLNIHPLTIIFLITIAISMFGFLGAFIAIPVYSVVKIIVRDSIRIIRFNKVESCGNIKE